MVGGGDEFRCADGMKESFRVEVIVLTFRKRTPERGSPNRPYMTALISFGEHAFNNPGPLHCFPLQSSTAIPVRLRRQTDPTVERP